MTPVGQCLHSRFTQFYLTFSIDTYTAQATVGDIQKGITNHKNLESNDTALLVFGNGDGGGGPLNKMLENVCLLFF